MNEISSNTFGNAPRDTVYSVSELNQAVNQLLTQALPLVWVEGEISNLARPGSGHWYFSLKDADAQVKAAMFRNRNMYCRHVPENGQRVRIRARVGLYEPRGEYQLVAEHMETAGEGDLQHAFERLKQQLATEGLFNPDNKLEIPVSPRCVGVITSPTGAAIRDVLSVLKRRCPLLEVIIYPVVVQGAEAPGSIARALTIAASRDECEVLLLVRGGGSLEDLQAFNTEVVARTLAACPIPVVSGVGHETDFTIADFVADLRAATPSAAAELVSPNSAVWLRDLRNLRLRLAEALDTQLYDQQRELQYLQRRLGVQHPEQRLARHQQRMDDLQQRLQRVRLQIMQRAQLQVQHLHNRLQQQAPANRLQQHRLRLANSYERLQFRIRHYLQQQQQQLALLNRSLNSISPLKTLERGYAIVTDPLQNRTVQDAQQTHAQQQLRIRLARGELQVRVEKNSD
ncbi:MAG: exodeoxyribonuclease VII large subunit [Gammaproteobacteria bacterium]|nr:exodeoxyribonuclease VII large subunit [Gammaproteobacteria bacterium]